MESLLLAIKATTSLPLQAACLAWRQYNGQETQSSVLQRLGISWESRPAGPLIWFHASTTDECAVALPVLFRCLLEYNDKVGVMLTTASLEAFHMLRSSLPKRVAVQLLPMDNALCMGLFMRKWQPTVCIMVESPFLPQLVLQASQHGVKLALINAHMESKDLLTWHARRSSRAQLAAVLRQYSLIVPQSDVDVGRFRICGANMKQMPGWCNELKYASLLGSSVWHLWKPAGDAQTILQRVLYGRPNWIAANTVHGEEEVVARLHSALAAAVSGLLTVVAPEDPGRCADVAGLLVGTHGLRVELWSNVLHTDPSVLNADVLLVDDVRQLSLFYRSCGLTFMGNSLLETCGGHSLAQAAVSASALLIGPHAGSCLHMAEELNNAALLAAEDAAAAVRSTGHVQDEGWGFDEEGGAGAQQASANVGQEDGADSGAQAVPDTPPSALAATSSPPSRQASANTMAANLQERSYTAASAGAGPSLSAGLGFRLSNCTEYSETDSLCSEDGQQTPVQLVRSMFGSPSRTSLLPGRSTLASVLGDSEDGDGGSTWGGGSVYGGGARSAVVHSALQLPGRGVSSVDLGVRPRRGRGSVEGGQDALRQAARGRGPLGAASPARGSTTPVLSDDGGASEVGRGRHGLLVAGALAAGSPVSTPASPHAGTSPLPRGALEQQQSVAWQHVFDSTVPDRPPWSMLQASSSLPVPRDSPVARFLGRTGSNTSRLETQASVQSTRASNVVPNQQASHSVPPPQQVGTQTAPPKPARSPRRLADAATQTDIGGSAWGGVQGADVPVAVLAAALLGAMGGARIAGQQPWVFGRPSSAPSAAPQGLRGSLHSLPVPVPAAAFAVTHALLDSSGPTLHFARPVEASLSGLPLRSNWAAAAALKHAASCSRSAPVAARPLTTAVSTPAGRVADPTLLNDVRPRGLSVRVPSSTWAGTSKASTPTAQTAPAGLLRAGGADDSLGRGRLSLDAPGVQILPAAANLLPPVTPDALLVPVAMDAATTQVAADQAPPLSSASPTVSFGFRLPEAAAAPAGTPQHHGALPHAMSRTLSRLATSSSWLNGAQRSSDNGSGCGGNGSGGVPTSQGAQGVQSPPGQTADAVLDLGLAVLAPRQSSVPAAAALLSRGSFSDPGSPGLSQCGSRGAPAHSDGHLPRSNSSSPQAGVRCSVSGWMTQPHDAQGPADAHSTVTLGVHPVSQATQATPPPVIALAPAVSPSCRAPLPTMPVARVSSGGSSAIPPVPSRLGSRPASLSGVGPTASSEAAPRAGPRAGSDQNQKSSGRANGTSRDGSMSQSGGGVGAGADAVGAGLRTVRTPRATGDASVDGAQGASGARSGNTAPLAATPRALPPQHSVGSRSLTIPELEALAAAGTSSGAGTSSPVEGCADDTGACLQDPDVRPETPTSRLSAMNSITSPFAGSAYDRADPFPSVSGAAATSSGHSHGVMTLGTQSDGDAAPDPFRAARVSQFALDSAGEAALAARLQAAGPISDNDMLPATPTSRASVIAAAASPFAMSTQERAEAAGTAPPDGAMFDDVWHGRMPTLGGGLAPTSLTTAHAHEGTPPMGIDTGASGDSSTVLSPVDGPTACGPAYPPTVQPEPSSQATSPPQTQLVQSMLRLTAAVESATPRAGGGSSDSAGGGGQHHCAAPADGRSGAAPPSASVELHAALEELVGLLDRSADASTSAMGASGASNGTQPSVGSSGISSVTLCGDIQASLSTDPFSPIRQQDSSGWGSARSPQAPGSAAAVSMADEPPQGSAALVLPGLHGPLLVAAPADLVSRLSSSLGWTGSGAAGLDSPVAARRPPASSTEEILDVLGCTHPPLPRLRLPGAASVAAPRGLHPVGAPPLPIPVLEWSGPSSAPAAVAYTSTFDSLLALHDEAGREEQQEGDWSLAMPLHLVPPVVTAESPAIGRQPHPLRPRTAAAAVGGGSSSDASASVGSMTGLVQAGLQEVPRPSRASSAANPLASHNWADSALSTAPASAQADGASSSSRDMLDATWFYHAPELSQKALPSPAPPNTGSGEHVSTPKPSRPATAQGPAAQVPQAERDPSASGTRMQPPHAGCGPAPFDSSVGMPSSAWTAAARTGGRAFVLPASQLPRNTGPAVWVVASEAELRAALLALLQDPLERRSRGYAAAQAAAKLASGLVNTVWHVLDDTVITPALHAYVQANAPALVAAAGPRGSAAATRNTLAPHA